MSAIYIKQPHMPSMGNNARAHNRRIREGFYDNFIAGHGLDIGCSVRKRSISADAILWDRQLGHGDATFLEQVSDNSFDYVMASHILEHIVDREEALRNWVRVTKPGGYLIVCVPERDLFEEKKTLPSLYNHDHKCFFKLDESEPPDTFSLVDLLKTAKDESDILYAKVCSENWNGQKNRTPENARKIYPVGEFQIEAVLRKKNV